MKKLTVLSFLFDKHIFIIKDTSQTAQTFQFLSGCFIRRKYQTVNMVPSLFFPVDATGTAAKISHGPKRLLSHRQQCTALCQWWCHCHRGPERITILRPNLPKNRLLLLLPTSASLLLLWPQIDGPPARCLPARALKARWKKNRNRRRNITESRRKMAVLRLQGTAIEWHYLVLFFFFPAGCFLLFCFFREWLLLCLRCCTPSFFRRW